MEGVSALIGGFSKNCRIGGGGTPTKWGTLLYIHVKFKSKKKKKKEINKVICIHQGCY